MDTLDASEDYDFSAYDGQTINVAFKYESTDTDAGRWRFQIWQLKRLELQVIRIQKVNTLCIQMVHWEAVEGVYYLSSEDFDSMGEGSGQPGHYNNFSSSISPDNYLPTFYEYKISLWARR